jgi:hypothetical protein
MPSRDEFIAAVTAFLAADKTLAGVDLPPPWMPSRTRPEQCIKVPIEVAGVQYGQQLVVVAPSGRADFAISVVYSVGIMRLDFEPLGGGHRNTLLAEADGLPGVVSGTHLHRWQHNVRFVEGDGRLEELKHAEELPSTIRTFHSALRYFCSEVRIHLPHGHRIELPGTLL